MIASCFPFSAYYPVFRSMLRNVVAALNEAQDITLYLKPLSQHFLVILQFLNCLVNYIGTGYKKVNIQPSPYKILFQLYLLFK